MAFPANPIDGQTYKNYVYDAQNMWKKIDSLDQPGNYDIGRLILIGKDNENTTTWWTESNPASGSIYTSPSAHTRVPAYAKGLYIRIWVLKGSTAQGDWYWMGFGRGDDTNLASDASTYAIGSEMINSGVYQHDTITVPIDSSGICKMVFYSLGNFSSFNANIVGYHI